MDSRKQREAETLKQREAEALRKVRAFLSPKWMPVLEKKLPTDLVREILSFAQSPEEVLVSKLYSTAHGHVYHLEYDEYLAMAKHIKKNDLLALVKQIQIRHDGTKIATRRTKDELISALHLHIRVLLILERDH